MKYIDEYRDPSLSERIVRQIRAISTRPWVLMEVCGGQTHGLLRHGIDQQLEDAVELIHGPGCPVCVTSSLAIDSAIRLARLPNTTVASFGDMLRVPGSDQSLLSARAGGANVKIVYSPLDAIQLAVQQPDRQVVFFAVGFETTIPATAIALLQAQQLGLRNFSVLVAHVRVLPAMELLMQAPGNRVQGFLAAGHVCTVTGFEAYQQFCKRYSVPAVVAGFEPVDLLRGILRCVELLESAAIQVANEYGRSVRRGGNPQAQQMVDSVYEPTDQSWRGFGVVPGGGVQLRPEFRAFDARERFADLMTQKESSERTAALHSSPALTDRCRAGEVLSGRLKPCDCPEYGHSCSPDHPLGAPMVSSEGACAAYFRYRPLNVVAQHKSIAIAGGDRNH
jgi:hydrogenase expression/formation protein HypD